MSTSRSRAVGALTLLGVASLVVAGCGGGAKNAAASSEAGSMEAFQACMRDQGVETPAGGPDGGGGAPPQGGGQGFSAENREAMEACRDKLPEGGFGGPGGQQMTDEQRAQFEEQQTKLQECLEKAGVELPGRGQGGQPPQPGGAPGERPQMDEKTQQAMTACREELGITGGPGGPGGPPPGATTQEQTSST